MVYLGFIPEKEKAPPGGRAGETKKVI